MVFRSMWSLVPSEVHPQLEAGHLSTVQEGGLGLGFTCIVRRVYINRSVCRMQYSQCTCRTSSMHLWFVYPVLCSMLTTVNLPLLRLTPSKHAASVWIPVSKLGRWHRAATPSIAAALRSGGSGRPPVRCAGRGCSHGLCC